MIALARVMAQVVNDVAVGNLAYRRGRQPVDRLGSEPPVSVLVYGPGPVPAAVALYLDLLPELGGKERAAEFQARRTNIVHVDSSAVGHAPGVLPALAGVFTF